MPYKNKEDERARHQRRMEDPEFRENRRLRRKQYYQENKEKILEKNRVRHHKDKEKNNQRRKENAMKNQEATNRRQREWYGRNKEDQASTAKQRKHRRDPTIGLKSALDKVRRGEAELSGVIKQFQHALDELGDRNGDST